jgi:hypothetical protein
LTVDLTQWVTSEPQVRGTPISLGPCLAWFSLHLIPKPGTRKTLNKKNLFLTFSFFGKNILFKQHCYRLEQGFRTFVILCSHKLKNIKVAPPKDLNPEEEDEGQI